MDYEMLVNKENLLSKDYIPEDMVEIHEPMGSKIDASYINRLNIEAYRWFKIMQVDAYKLGYEIFIDSSYRDYEYQERVFNATAAEKGLDHALKYVAPPGGSEHQTGLAFDVIFRRNGEMIEEQLETDPEISWLHRNAFCKTHRRRGRSERRVFFPRYPLCGMGHQGIRHGTCS